MTGAARLASAACMRAGAGLCSLVAAGGSGPVYRASLSAHILVEDFQGAFSGHFSDGRRTAALLGPGGGEAVRDAVPEALQWRKPCVLDADALTCFADDLDVLFGALHESCVLTPHMGEFKAVFPDLTTEREVGAVQSAERSGAVVVLKGARTIIAAPGGRAVMNDHADPYLATAGAGDVLAGLIAGFLAQGVPPFDAACAAVWIHGETGIRFGPGLVASDLPDMVPAVLQDLFL